ncbi:glycosyltransferase family 4 protein [bacterium]|nr:glycosyltransferase family 4 protein [bacterium]
MNSFKLCVPFRYKPEGGVYSFIRNLISYLDRHGLPYTHDVDDDYSVLLAFSFKHSYERILEIKMARPTVRVVQRIDGAARDYGRTDDADRIQSEVNRLADLTIFQSCYARYATREKYPLIGQDGPVIYNAVDTEQFTPEGGKIVFPFSRAIACVSFSTNPRKGASDVYEAARLCPETGFVLCGRFIDPPDLPNIRILGHLDHAALAEVYRSCAAVFFPSENEACPNVVLESLAAGTPVLYKDSGATPELVGDCGAAVTVSNFRDRLEWAMSRRPGLSAAARSRALLQFSPDVIFPQYFEAMSRTRRRPVLAAARA